MIWSPSPSAVQSFFSLRSKLFEMTAFAADEDVLGRAVVLLEQHDLGAREVALELDDVADVGAAEGVDRLVGVADDGEAAPGMPPEASVSAATLTPCCSISTTRSAGTGRVSSRMSEYCAWLVSWYSSTRMWRNRRW